MKRWRLAHSETMSYLKSKLNSPVATAPWASPCITWFVVLAAGAPTCPWRKPCRCDPGNCSSTNLQRPPTHRSSWHSWSGPYPGMTGIDYETGWNGSIDGLTKKNNISILEMKRGAIGGSFRTCSFASAWWCFYSIWPVCKNYLHDLTWSNTSIALQLLGDLLPKQI